MILYNGSADQTDQETDNHFLPVSHIQFSQGQALLAFLGSHTGRHGHHQRRRQGHPAGRRHGVVQLARRPGPVARRQQA